MAQLLTDASRALDANGNPYAGAQWRFYASGTLTPLAVYADAAKSTSLGSVVTADGGGRFVPIYFDDAIAYRGRQLDASGTLIPGMDIDPMNTGGSSSVGLFIGTQASEAISVGAFINLSDTGQIRNADASDPEKFATGFAVSSFGVGATGMIAGFGINTAVTLDDPYPQVWLSDVEPGGFLTSPPSADGSIVQSLGMGIPGLGIVFTPQPWVLL